ncbi:ABC transporter ATP-binding protein [Tamlana crocina]|uniref:ATP-binding cassette domain-containing protein n=1 Tax=Tamlana crocina TaxID=393006 RepID=A0ABX1DDK5_9FLAO|nr:ATP-binding cassette domain-containing protein [Tamlana crocina]NJX16434.1 ATP-binding cassette domain-containing protein [Tamlana crocina]
MIHTSELSFKYKNSDTLFRFPEIDLDAQDSLLILGESGIGKTTLLHLLAGILKPDSGKITIHDTDLNSLTRSQMDKFRGEHIGLVFQKKHAIPSLSVYENLKTRLFFSDKHIDELAVDTVLEQLNLKACKHKNINEISEGQLQRLGIAMAVIHQPKVILADEPTSSLDDKNCNMVINLLKEQAEKNNANLIVITHDHRIKHVFQNTITL